MQYTVRWRWALRRKAKQGKEAGGGVGHHTGGLGKPPTLTSFRSRALNEVRERL